MNDEDNEVADTANALGKRKMERAAKARTLTRRINELGNAIDMEAPIMDVEEKVNNI